jgi:hypothetical protein
MKFFFTALLIILIFSAGVLGEATDGDREKESILASGKIVKTVPLPVGTTHPLKVTLSIGEKIHFAVFKNVDFSPKGVTKFQGQKPTLQFTDTFRHDRAAYMVDRLIGLRMVPVTIIRNVRRKRGALVDWIPDATTELKRRTGDLSPEAGSILNNQWAIMHMFDAIINNPDRNLGNQLFTQPDWKLHLIDHTRAFSRSRSIPDTYTDEWSRIPRHVYEALKNMDEDTVLPMFRTLLSKAQVRDMFIRRDLIIKKIDLDIVALGEEVVFLE